MVIPVKWRLLRFADDGGARAFTPDSSRCLNCSSNLIGHDDPNKPANGVGNNGTFSTNRGQGPHSQSAAENQKRG
jgi:hypothetical protein